MTSGEQKGSATKQHGEGEPKWAAVVEDRLAPMPRRQLKARDILHQSGAKAGLILVRDYDSPNDIGFDPDAVVDLAGGNVFRAMNGCRCSHEISCEAPPKLAFIVDDRWEVTIQPHQTGETLRGLLAVPADAELLRDHESPLDEPIEDDEAVEFADGPVFITRCDQAKEFTIIVNGRKKTVKKRKLSFNDVVALAFDPVPTGPNIMFTITYRHGPHANPEGTLIEGGHAKIKDGMIFNVTQTDKS